MFLLHKAVKQEKGHGYLRKTKLGLLSGIILTTALGSLFLNGIAVYEIEFYVNGRKFEYYINSNTGEIIKFR